MPIRDPNNPDPGVPIPFAPGPVAKIINEPAGNVIINEPANQILNQSGYGRLVNQQGGPLFNLFQAAAAIEIDGYGERFNTTDGEAYRYFDVPWPNRGLFFQTALGYSQNKGGTLSRTLPDQHPEYPWLWCVDYELVKGVGAIGTDINSGMIAYYNTDPTSSGIGLARCKLIYRQPDYEVRPDGELSQLGTTIPELYRFVTADSEYAAQNLPLPGQANLLQWAEGPQKKRPIANGAGVKIFPTKEVTFVWHDVPDVPEAAIDQVIGNVNESAFFPPVAYTPPGGGGAVMVGGYGTSGYPPETLLCMAPRKVRRRGPGGRVVWTITYKFLYRPNGWNRFPYIDSTSGAVSFFLATYTGDPDGQPLYAAVDFDPLFTQPAPVNYLNNRG